MDVVAENNHRDKNRKLYTTLPLSLQLRERVVGGSGERREGVVGGRGKKRERVVGGSGEKSERGECIETAALVCNV